MLDTIESDDKEDIENLMRDSDTKFIEESLIENGDLSLSTSCLDIENHLRDSKTPTLIEAVVKISEHDSDSDDDVPLSSLQVPKADKEWKWRKQFKRTYVEKYVLTVTAVVNSYKWLLIAAQFTNWTRALRNTALEKQTEQYSNVPQIPHAYQTSTGHLCLK